jgi:nucleoside-diphosphate-sugar epimerase
MRREEPAIDLAGSTIAVTGATGFIGRYIVRALANRGCKVVAVVRNPERAATLKDHCSEIRQADLADQQALAKAFHGVDAVVSNAAMVSVGGKSKQELIATNVDGTSHIFEAMVEAGVKRCVQTSSAVAYRSKKNHYYHEDDPLRSADEDGTALSYYAVSKACAEERAWQLSRDFNIGLTTVRPHTVYGANDRGTFTRWLKRLMAPPISVFPAKLLLPPVYAGDLAEAICRIFERPQSIGRAYNIAGEPGKDSYWDMMCAYRRAGGRTPLLVLPIPVPMKRSYSISRAEQDLDFINCSLEDGFRDTIRLESNLQ